MTIREQMEEREMSHSVISDRFFRGTETGSCTVRHSGA